ncbi:hypothetical protein EVG20_g4482 [Dentipellis fragilis]|uniref:Uncharacterized protein n=1 Tax=Dentipellis fragilis TaxID=205917 RepID=A0A4Y9YYC6_9AGAM|nr:hypothetical protein EVG20_g4482 [Dentipellis fragilis]
MATEPPPTLINQPAVSTPSEVWAASTTNALDTTLESSEATGGALATVTDADPIVPGGFPGGPGEDDVKGAAIVGADGTKTETQEVIEKANLPKQDDVKKTVQPVSKTAAAYIPAGVANAGHTVAQYLPAGVTDAINSYLRTSYFAVPYFIMLMPHIKSLPSQEILGLQPHEHVEGAGELPGTVFERGVARLPEEHMHGHYTGSEVVEGADVVTASEHDKPHLKSLPSQEKLGFQPHEHVDGAGELPGTVFESGVARLPEERRHGDYTGSEALTVADVATASEHDRPHIKSFPSQELVGFQPHEHVDGAGELPGTVFERGVARTPEERRHGSYTGPEALTGANVVIASEHDRPHIKSLPSQELVGFQPHEHVEGAGELPGTVDESGVARLPDDRTPGTQTPAAGGAPIASTTASSAVVGVSAASSHTAGPPTQDQEQGGVKPKEVAKEQTGSSDKVGQGPQPNLQAREWTTWQGVSNGAHKHGVSSDDADRTDADVRARVGNDEVQPPHSEPAKTSQALNAPSATNGHSADQSASPVEAKSGHKAGFLERVRGEAKILVGKLAGDKHKVEEGKHTKAGDA